MFAWSIRVTENANCVNFKYNTYIYASSKPAKCSTPLVTWLYQNYGTIYQIINTLSNGMAICRIIYTGVITGHTTLKNGIHDKVTLSSRAGRIRMSDVQFVTYCEFVPFTCL